MLNFELYAVINKFRCCYSNLTNRKDHHLLFTNDCALVKNVCQRKTGGYEKSRKKGVGRSPPYLCCMKVLAN